MASDTSGNEGSPRRRSGRLSLHVKVRLSGANVEGNTFEERSETLEVSKYGARVTLHHDLKVGSIMGLERPDSERQARFKVVYQAPPDPATGRRETGIEFVGVDSFWGIDFPPDLSQWK